MHFSRRTLLKTGFNAGLNVGIAGLATMALPFSSVLGASNAPEWIELAPGLALVRGAGSNVLVNWGSDGVAMLDGGHADYAASLMILVNEKTGNLPSLLFNTHCHQNQIGCNPVLGLKGASIIAHENTRLWLSTEIISKWEGEVYEPLAATALPNKTFIYDTQTVQFNEKIEYGVMNQAHTDGDIYVFFPERNILFAGDVVSPERYPVIDFSTNGWVGGMIDGLDTLLAIGDDDTRIFASTGAEVNKTFLQAQKEMLVDIIGQISTNYYSGGTFPEFIATNPSAAFDAQWGDPRLFLTTAYKSVEWHTGDIRRYVRR